MHDPDPVPRPTSTGSTICEICGAAKPADPGVQPSQPVSIDEPPPVETLPYDPEGSAMDVDVGDCDEVSTVIGMSWRMKPIQSSCSVNPGRSPDPISHGIQPCSQT